VPGTGFVAQRSVWAGGGNSSCEASIQAGGPTTLANGALVHKHCHPKSQKEVAAFAEKWKDKIASGALDVRPDDAKQAKDEAVPRSNEDSGGLICYELRRANDRINLRGIFRSAANQSCYRERQ